jgi:predicted PurR-regulated permease PerM
MAIFSRDLILPSQWLGGTLLSLLIIISATTILTTGKLILAPILFSIVIGLMFGPVADRIERLGVPSTISAIIVVMLFSGLILSILSAIIIPLSGWFARLPALWESLQQIFADWQGLMSALNGVKEKIDILTEQDADMVVQVDEGSPIKNVVTIAPTVLAQILMFLASLYFFVVTRKQILATIVGQFFSHKAGYCVARIFRDVERHVSRYLLSISLINIAVAIVVSAALWSIGVPGALMWGLLAGLLNYITYIGPAIMIACLLAVGLMSFEPTNAAFLPAALYLTINFIESQFITPLLIGRAMTLNPFLVFFTITFWIWAWGPLGGFVAVPSLLIGKAILSNLARFNLTYARKGRNNSAPKPLSI